MALDLFRVALGLSIDDNIGDRAASIISGSGAPGGDGDIQDAQPIGSIYLRTDASTTIASVYQKVQNSNATADWVQSASKTYVDNLINGMSWRPPVVVLDNTLYADITAAETAANVADQVDGVTIAADDRLLFTNLTTGNENVYIVSGTTGAWTFTEDTKAAEDGDALLIQEGSLADSQWIYDGAEWVQIGSTTNNAELAFIRTFIGKVAAGSELPTYSSTNNITQNENLTVAIGDLDAALGDRTYTSQFIITNGESVASSLDELDLAIGDRTYTSQNFVINGESITASIDALDQAIADQLFKVEVTGVTTATTVDTVLVDEVQAIKWFVTVFNEGTPDNKESFEVFAMHNGSAAGDATVIDFNISSKLRFNPKIAGLDIDVVLAGTGVGQTMGLEVSANSAVTVHATRLTVLI